MRRLGILSLLLAAVAAAPAAGAEGPGLTPEVLWSLVRLGDPQPSPSGRMVAYVTRSYSVEENDSTSSLWMVDAQGRKAPVRLTRSRVHDHSPRWINEETLLFLSDRGGSSQIWALNVHGGEPFQVSRLPVDVGNLVAGPGGRQVAFTADVYTDCSDLACTAARSRQEAETKADVRVYTDLLYRHWDTWEDHLRSHIFVAPLVAGDKGNGEPPLRLGPAVDLMGDMNADAPPRPFGGTEAMVFAPDGHEMVFAARVLDGSAAAWQTDTDLYRAPVDGKTPPRRVTTGNRAWDGVPAFSSDGRWLAHLAMARPGFEADRTRLMLRPFSGGAARELTADWDASPGSLAFTADAGAMLVSAQDRGRLKLYVVDVSSGQRRPLVSEYHNTSAAVAGDRVVFLQDGATFPARLMSVPLAGGKPVVLADPNAGRMAGMELRPAEDFIFKGDGGDEVHGFIVRPPDYRKGRTYPVAFLIHGGPQGAWQDQFHYRWNPQIWASAGYLTLAINFHGSTGYGQKFTDAVSRNWGGAPFRDLMLGLDRFLEVEPAADGKRVCALGASYGGYMINWIAGHTDRFSCLINHDGVFDTRMTWFTTEELWFPEWEFGGTPWESAELYERWNPSRFVDRWKTPMLVIHGARDYRLADTQSLAAFTALRRRDIPARLVHFPAENHWVLKPANAMVWHREVMDWMQRWTAPVPGGAGR